VAKFNEACSVRDPLTRTTMFYQRFSVPAVLSKLLYLHCGAGSIPVSHPNIFSGYYFSNHFLRRLHQQDVARFKKQCFLTEAQTLRIKDKG